jgi:CheY-like chemotaxis protein
MRMIFKERVHEKQLQMIFEIPDDLPKCVFADDQKLRQIFINLIGNAIKFTDHGGVTVVTRVNKVNGDTNRLIVEIQDSGPGIPEDELGKLFKQFELTSAGIRTSSGTGLGLALSLELAMLMDGNITVKSTVGKGSVFTIDVVVHDGVADGSEAVITKRVIRINNPHDIYRILVVDDKEENRQVVVSFLKLVGFQTNEAINGEEAITKFEQWNPHLILMDFRMPVMDGYEATRLIKTTEKGKQTPIIAMTASLFEDKKENTPAPQIQGYIRKPFHENELFAAIGKALGIGYIYEEETSADTPSRYLDNPGMIGEELSKLPTNFILQMQEAIEGADFHLLIHLIKTIENDNSELARHLLTKAHNYDYIYLQKILISKTSNK